MGNSDDEYFSDDWVLDDKTLAVLDEEESKFKRITNSQTQQIHTQPRQSVGPPPKRQKTAAASWQPQPATVHRTDSLEDMYDLPDVSVRQDGTYGLQDRQRHTSGLPSNRSGIAPGPNPNVVAQTMPGSTIRYTTTPLVSRSSAPLRSASGTGVARAVAQVPSHPPSSARGMRATQSPVSSQEVSRTQSGPPQRVNRIPSATNPSGHVDQLLQQIEELRKKNETMRTEMESAMEVKFAKEGEVAILRKRLEKTAQDHMAQVTKLKHAKDEADAKHVLLQKQFEADKERLKTELTFRRHELETSSRVHPPAGLPKNDIGPLPTQRQRSSQWNSAGPSRLAPETPRRPRFGIISDFEKPKKNNVSETRDLPSGFQTSPLRSQSIGMRKGVETSQAAAAIPSATPVLQQPSIRFSQPDPEVFDALLDDSDLVPNFNPQADDVHMIDEATPATTFFTQENVAVLALSGRNQVLHDIMLTHTLRGSEIPTLQLLVCASPKDTGQAQSYGAALMRVLDTLGRISTQPDSNFDDLARIICCALCKIIESLIKNNSITPLTAILNLLTELAYMSPSLHVPLLRVADQDESPHLLGMLHTIIQTQLQALDITTGNVIPELCSLGKETLRLYEALVSWTSNDLEDSLSACPSAPSLLTALLHPHRPLWFLIESTWLLTWMSTRWALFRSLLSHPASESTENDGEQPNAVHHPQIGLICSFLTDTDRQGPEADELKSRVIMLFGMLSNAHPDAYALLVESQELIPSIVFYVCHVAAPIWHENGTVSDDPLAATRTIDIINYATLILYHLVTGEDAVLDLRECLLRARTKTQEAPIHFFILTFGRLSYANPPQWLSAKDKQRLVEIGALASALLERVIQGPELDLIWGTYQREEEESNEADMDVDDEEVEAQKVANA